MEEINSEMQDIGYTIDRENPGLLVKTHIMFEQEENVVADPIYNTYDYYYPGYSVGYASPYYYTGYNTINEVVGYNIDEVEYTEGTIAVDIINAENNEIVWRGWAKDKGDVEDIKNELKVYIDEIFDEYPVDVQS